MYILTPDNVAHLITESSMTESEDRYFGSLHYEDGFEIDYYFNTLFFFDEITAPIAVLDVGGHTVELPYNWHILICDKHLGIIEPILISEMNGRTFDSWGFNHISGYTPKFHEVKLVDVLPARTFIAPRLKNCHFLTVPIETGKAPDCIYAIGDSPKIPETLDITKLI